MWHYVCYNITKILCKSNQDTINNSNLNSSNNSSNSNNSNNSSNNITNNTTNTTNSKLQESNTYIKGKIERKHKKKCIIIDLSKYISTNVCNNQGPDSAIAQLYSGNLYRF